jgi:hypothetical protein
MLLVPRQLQRAGMTGSVPYYGGRFSPAQAYAASHPPARPAPSAAPRVAAPAPTSESLAALQRLRDEGVLSDEEYADLVGRVSA